MARKPRLEFVGALYHVLNRAPANAGLFASPTAADAFVDCLFEACRRMRWRLHAFCLMPDRYHLALETPRGNLVAGVHWLQSAFGNRHGRSRVGGGPAFRGRYRAILVEPGERWTETVDGIHLAAVQAGLVPPEHLSGFRWSSLRWHRRGPDRRPSFLACGTWLESLGLDDTPDGWDRYEAHLGGLARDEAKLRNLGMANARGWAAGSPEFRRAVAGRMLELRQGSGGELAVENRREWQARLDEGLERLHHGLPEAAEAPKAAPWKIALAAWLKSNTSVLNRWLSDRLNMGPPDAVSRYVGELRKGLRPAAAELFSLLPAPASERASPGQ